MALKLGKGSALVKSRLRRLPQSDVDWEADFLTESDYWTGIVIERDHGSVFAIKTLQTPPSVNDLARLLADAMQRPLCDVGMHRPRNIRLRANSEWMDLVPHLEELGIELVFSGTLSAWDAAVADYASPE